MAKSIFNIKRTFTSVVIVSQDFTPLFYQPSIKFIIIFVSHVRQEGMNVMVILFSQMMVIGIKILIVI